MNSLGYNRGMSPSRRFQTGSIGWVDLTVRKAEPVRRFYEATVGWRAEPVDMGGSSDYTMSPPGNRGPVAVVCHKRGVNAGLPSVWMIYITAPTDVQPNPPEGHHQQKRSISRKPKGPCAGQGSQHRILLGEKE